MTYHFYKNIIVIVSAYSSGAMLAPLFKGRGYRCVHVTTRREWDIQRLKSYYQEADFAENFIIDTEEDLVSVINELKKFNIKLIMPGCESGVSLADRMSQYFDVPKNIYTLTSARRNKYLMLEAIKAHSVYCADQYKSNNLESILQWFQKSNYSQVVLKPLSSSSSDSVFYCRTESEITNAFNAILGAKDMYDEINQEVLVQEFVKGDEYIVNTVSRDDSHYVVDIWKGVSKDKSIVSNDSYADLIHPTMQEYKLLDGYVKSVLPALGICNGAAHSEIKLTPKGPCLIETGARLAGKVDFSSIEEIFGYSQISLTIEALLEPEIFMQRLSSPSCPRKYARYVYFASDKEGIIHRDPDLKDMLDVDSLMSLKYLPTKGDRLLRTSKIFRSPRPGYAYLIADTAEKIEKDYAALCHAESNVYTAIIRDCERS